MSNSNPNSMAELLAALHKGHERLIEVAQSTHPATYFEHAPGVWSVAEHVEHLCIVARQFTTGLGLPKLALLARFGRPDHPSADFETLRLRYTNQLIGGLVATGSFVPQLAPVSDDFDSHHAAHLARWSAAAMQLRQALAKWSERDLESVAMPMPALGSLTGREMLCFFVFHDQHHLRDIQSILAQGHDSSRA